MGAHTLGRMANNFSGYRDSNWVRNEHLLDNQFYRSLVDDIGRYIQENECNENGLFSWLRSNRNLRSLQDVGGSCERS